MVGRPKEFNEEKAQERVMEVFWRKGYKATTLDDLLRATKLSKSSFYATFGNKENAFRLSMGLYREKLSLEMKRQLAASVSAKTFIEDIMAIAVREAETGMANGCLLMNSLAELGQRHPEFSQDLKESISVFEGIFEEALKRGIDEGSYSEENDTSALASFLSNNLGFLRMMAKIGKTADEVRRMVPTVLLAVR